MQPRSFPFICRQSLFAVAVMSIAFQFLAFTPKLVSAFTDISKNKSDARPNIVWIMSEDNSKHYLKMFDEMGAETPNIQKLAASGVTFNRAFSNAPVCSVARTTLITGVYAPRLGTHLHRRTKLATMPGDWKMFPEYLRDAGYYTTNNSKKDFNANESPNVWDESSPRANWRKRPEGKPFFHVQTFGDSHESSLHFDQAWADAPDNKTDPDSVTLAPYHPDTPLFRLTYARYHDRIQTIDQKVGDLIGQLENDGLLEDTIVFYFGDHGGVLPRGKGYIYESGLHVPLVVRIPERWKQLSPFSPGSSTQGFVEFVDFGPTVLKLAGIEPSEHFDGKAFLGDGVLESEVNKRDETFSYCDRMDEKYDHCRAIRVGDWKYIRNYNAIYPDSLQNNYRYIMLAYGEWRQLFKSGKLTPAQSQFFLPKPVEQLFDLSNDPHEINDLSKTQRHLAKLVEMRERLGNRVASLPDLGMFPETHLIASALEAPIQFGQDHKKQIENLVNIADLSLLPFVNAEPRIAMAIESEDQWERYWGYTVCSTFGTEAARFFESAKKAAASDDNEMVRLRAAEFLGVAKHADPIPTIRNIVETSESAVANLYALQTLVHFKDGPYSFDTEIDSAKINSSNGEVIRRVGYINGLSQSEIKTQIRDLRRKSNKPKQPKKRRKAG